LPEQPCMKIKQYALTISVAKYDNIYAKYDMLSKLKLSNELAGTVELSFTAIKLMVWWAQRDAILGLADSKLRVSLDVFLERDNVRA